MTPPPPLPLPDKLIDGSTWQFASLTAAALERDLLPQPMPIQGVPGNLLPSRCGVASSTPIPGVVISGGRRVLKLAQWVATQTPLSLKFFQGSPSGLVLTSELNQRWVLLTFTDLEVNQAAQTFEQRKAAAQGLHFLLVQPDDSGVTYTGLFVFQESLNH
jgi:hypothetical protein